ncbi:MAG TPA: hypothetical protein VLE97_01950 [Gaiellaceae bacterium]|nr:hypothetical protein [Gaiellaceae bacterium]
MAITTYSIIDAATVAALATAVQAAIGAGKQPYGPPIQTEGPPYPTRYSQVVIDGTPPGTMQPSAIADIVGLQAALDALQTGLDGKLAPSDLITAAGGLMEGDTIDPALIA